jgi:hypothetical protein
MGERDGHPTEGRLAGFDVGQSASTSTAGTSPRPAPVPMRLPQCGSLPARDRRLARPHPRSRGLPAGVQPRPQTGPHEHSASSAGPTVNVQAPQRNTRSRPTRSTRLLTAQALPGAGVTAHEDEGVTGADVRHWWEGFPGRCSTTSRRPRRSPTRSAPVVVRSSRPSPSWARLRGVSRSSKGRLQTLLSLTMADAGTWTAGALGSGPVHREVD